MNSTQLAVLAAIAVLVFWLLGGYNRLMALRGAIGRAYAQLDEGLQRRAATLTLLLGLLRSPLAAEQLALDALLSALKRAGEAAAALRARPADAAAAGMLSSAEAALASALHRVRSLMEHHTALLADAQVAARQGELHDAQMRIAFARQLFNDAVQAYNGARSQFPTRLLARLYRLDPAAPI